MGKPERMILEDLLQRYIENENNNNYDSVEDENDESVEGNVDSPSLH